MSYNLPVLASDIPANLQISLKEECYFKCGDDASLREKLQSNLNSGVDRVDYDMSQYNWETIVEQTKEVYNQVLGNNSKTGESE